MPLGGQNVPPVTGPHQSPRGWVPTNYDPASMSPAVPTSASLVADVIDVRDQQLATRVDSSSGAAYAVLPAPVPGQHYRIERVVTVLNNADFIVGASGIDLDPTNLLALLPAGLFVAPTSTVFTADATDSNFIPELFVPSGYTFAVVGIATAPPVVSMTCRVIYRVQQLRPAS